MYIHRAIEQTILKAGHQTKAVLITGARQVGKSTTIKKLYPNYIYITLDDENYAALAKNDSALFSVIFNIRSSLTKHSMHLNCSARSKDR